MAQFRRYLIDYLGPSPCGPGNNYSGTYHIMADSPELAMQAFTCRMVPNGYRAVKAARPATQEEVVFFRQIYLGAPESAYDAILRNRV
jgi:hypothetical protein